MAEAGNLFLALNYTLILGKNAPARAIAFLNRLLGPQCGDLAKTEEGTVADDKQTTSSISSGQMHANGGRVTKKEKKKKKNGM